LICFSVHVQQNFQIRRFQMALSPRMGCLGNVTGVLWTKTLWGTHQDHLLDTIAGGTSASKHAIQHTEEDCTYRPPTSKVEAAFLNEIGLLRPPIQTFEQIS